MIEGKKAVTFDSNDLLVWDQNAPDSISGPNSWTVIYEVFNTVIADDEEILCWAQRGGTDGTYAAFCYGKNATFGAAALWGTADVNFARGVPAAHTWHTIAITYAGGTDGRLYVITDGQINTNVTRTLDIRPNQIVTVGAPFSVNTSSSLWNTWTKGYTPNYSGYRYNGSVAKIEVFDYALTPQQLAMRMGSPVNMNADTTVNFKDLALFANQWMVGPVLLQ
jgi:hypothetical protein